MISNKVMFKIGKTFVNCCDNCYVKVKRGWWGGGCVCKCSVDMVGMHVQQSTYEF